MVALKDDDRERRDYLAYFVSFTVTPGDIRIPRLAVTRRPTSLSIFKLLHSGSGGQLDSESYSEFGELQGVSPRETWNVDCVVDGVNHWVARVEISFEGES